MAKQPVHTIRFGLIKASIWQDHTKSGERHSVTVTRLFRNGAAWKESARFGRDDLPLLRMILDLAHTWIFEHLQARRTGPTMERSHRHLSFSSPASSDNGKAG